MLRVAASCNSDVPYLGSAHRTSPLFLPNNMMSDSSSAEAAQALRALQAQAAATAAAQATATATATAVANASVSNPIPHLGSHAELLGGLPLQQQLAVLVRCNLLCHADQAR